MTFAREAWVFVLPGVFLSLTALLFQCPRTALALGLLAALVLAFFRIPARSFTGSPETLLAPANGTVTQIVRVREPLLGTESFHRISTFLSVFNVHVQRAPAGGRVLTSKFTPGRKIAAFRPQAGEVNESHFVVLETARGDKIGVKQIAGLLARRVVSYLESGQELDRGEVIGVIKFGSRVDLFVPEAYELLIGKGDHVIEGLTPVASAPSDTGPAGQEADL